MPPYIRSSSLSSSSGLAPFHPPAVSCYSSSSSSSLSSSSSSSSSRECRSEGSKVADVARKEDRLLRHAAAELEGMRVAGNRRRASPPLSLQRRTPASDSSEGEADDDDDDDDDVERPFPPACLRLILSLPGNASCHDCGDAKSTTWASVSHGITLCLQCCGRHRGMGVSTSYVKSLTLDHWKRREILCMLEGGNSQLTAFFERHGMGTSSLAAGSCAGALSDRYATKAASFYRQRLVGYVGRIARGGPYQGREASRGRSGGGEMRTVDVAGPPPSAEGKEAVRATMHERE
ncbi:hypothetical protein ACHAXA_008201 [Cyclostephanos tholiformis]|uniref:Arf-GAP domain-containing protein n=1 Tax=Cyclostephanos tholiformis TaxID=382380 RepID=A0ABD3SCC6_9STRA